MKQQVYSIAFAQKKFGASSWRFSKKLIELGIAKRNELSGVVTLNRYIPAALARDIAVEIKVLVNATDAAKMLGLDRIMMVKLSSAGLVQRYFSSCQNLILYLPEEVHRFLGVLRDATTKGDCQGKNVSVPQSDRSLRLSAGGLVGIILNNIISVTADGPSNARFYDFRVSTSEVKETFFLDGAASVRLSRAAETLKINTSTVYALISFGVLRSINVGI